MENWSLDEVPWHAIDLACVREREDIFYLVTAASFVEITADLYTDNLALYFEDDEEVLHWLQQRWRVEEVRHGKVLRSYVRHVWPEFEWDAAYAAFYANYSRQCTVSEFEPTRELEMVARCVVETGTSTFYQTLAELAGEPVLKNIATRIRAEEINHYKHFYRYFRKLSAIDRPSRWQIFSAIKRRVFEARRDDAECALWHAFTFRYPDARADNTGKAEFQSLNDRLGRQIKHQYPVAMAAKMLLKPLDLPVALTRIVEGPVARWSAWILQH